jgi:hypothetical protein
MADSSNFNSAGVAVAGFSIANTAVASGINNQNKENNNFKIARVTAVFVDNTIFFETGINFTKSDLGTPNPKNKAKPINLYNFQKPQVGEYIELIMAPEALGLSADKNSNNRIVYYGRVLPAWDNINGNKVLDQTVQGQKSSNPMTSINQNNINKSFILGGV